ncbi:MAG: protein translocase subunit SecF [Clostridia bacterium]|nr:protein translocase subunit SecF [Clostridia bacterium]
MLNIYKNRWIYAAVSVAIILVGLVFSLVGGFNIDIDFAGGTSIMINLGQEASKDDVAAVCNEALGFNVSAVQPSLDNPNEMTIKTKNLTEAEADAVIGALKTKYSLADDFSDYSISTFTPAYGKQLAGEALWAVVIAVILMLVYITIRFEFLSGLSAIIALIHDVLIMISVYAIFRVPVNSSFIAVVLTILGYSINNTIVIFDRIRENQRMAKKETFAEITDKSITQTLGRSINTTITTFVMVAVLYVLGVESIKEFAFPLIIGILGGAYSSIFIVSPLWASMKTAGLNQRKKAMGK